MQGEDWEFDGSGWQLDAQEAGESWICFCPNDSIGDAEGRSLLFHWSQWFAGSSQNFSRVHLISRPPSAWDWANNAPFSVAEWNNDSILSPLIPAHFLHLGETGSLDSMRWMLSSEAEIALEIASNESPIPGGGIEHWMRWEQPANSDSVSIDWSAPSAPFEWQHTLHGSASIRPDCIGFSSRFTASHTTDFRIEVIEVAEHLPDTTPPQFLRFEWLNDHTISLQFDEPLSSELGFGLWNQNDTVFFVTEEYKSNRRIGLIAGDFPIGQPRNLTLHALRDAHDIQLSNPVVEVLRTSSDDMEQHQMQFTEIMFDPSPPIGFPEEEWIEIFNRSGYFHAIQDFFLLDGSSETQSTLLPGFNWDGILPPGERMIITGGEVSIAGSAVRQARGIPWPGLNNTGESLAMLGNDGSIADEIHFASDWMPEGNSGGISLQIVDWDACNNKSNWSASLHPLGSTPGTISDIEGSSPFEYHDTMKLLEIVPHSLFEGVMKFNQPLDPRSKLKLSGAHSGQLTFNIDNDSALAWRLHSLASADEVSFFVSGVESCAPFAEKGQKWLIQIEAKRFPAFQDLIITEIAHQPMGMTALWGSFVEVTNVHPTDSLELGGMTCNDSSPLGRIILAPGQRHCFRDIDLPNASGLVSIRSADGELIDEVSYSNCWHKQRANEESGRSLVRMSLEGGAHSSFNWASSLDDRGCSPGDADPAEVQTITNPRPMPLLCGILNNRWAILFNGAIEYESTVWEPASSNAFGTWAEALETSQLWIGPSQFEALEDSFALMKWSDGMTSIISICPSSAFISDEFVCDFVLNEIQQLKLNGPEPFIEILHTEHQWLNTDLLQWTTTTTPNPADWNLVSPEVRWFIPQNSAVAFSRCPSRWSSHEGSIIPADLPSLWGKRELQLARSSTFVDSIHLQPSQESPWSSWNHLRSLERVGELGAPFSNCAVPTNHWESSLDARGATPGHPNSWGRQTWPVPETPNPLTIINDTWRSTNDGAVQPVRLLLCPPGQGAWQVQLSVSTATCLPVTSLLNQPAWLPLGECLEVAWEGFARERIPPPGTYWIVGHFFQPETNERRKYFQPIHIMPWR